MCGIKFSIFHCVHLEKQNWKAVPKPVDNKKIMWAGGNTNIAKKLEKYRLHRICERLY